jgi:UDP-glucose 4-epimerase
LLEAGYEVIGLDNLLNSSPNVISRIEKITNKKVLFLEADVQDEFSLSDLFKKNQIEGVIHFAALKAVGESVQRPLDYYSNNLNGLLNLLGVMARFDCHNFVFSSSATVYHPENLIPYVEGMPLGSTSPYGWTNFMSEQVLSDLEVSNSSWRVAYLRYFNPVGAHPSGLIGEDPQDAPNNLMPFITQVAIGKLKELSIFGGDWPTHDGTGVRDYIHVQDLARGHVKAIEYLINKQQSLTVNLGAGKGYSVLDLVRAFEKASGQKIPYQITNRRVGDIAAFYADANLAKDLLDWEVEYDLDAMCRDSWRWQSNNPNGYED